MGSIFCKKLQYVMKQHYHILWLLMLIKPLFDLWKVRIPIETYRNDMYLHFFYQNWHFEFKLLFFFALKSPLLMSFLKWRKLNLPTFKINIRFPSIDRSIGRKIRNQSNPVDIRYKKTKQEKSVINNFKYFWSFSSSSSFVWLEVLMKFYINSFSINKSERPLIYHHKTTIQK